MVVSHARDFLNVVCTDILHLHSRKLTSYKGDFDTFERTATERLRNAKKAAEGQERQRAHMQVVRSPFAPHFPPCMCSWHQLIAVALQREGPHAGSPAHLPPIPP